MLDAFRWAPSASNKQPWRLVRSGETWHFYLQRVDLGIAMCHFELAARERSLVARLVIDQPALAAIAAGLEYTVSWVPEVG